MSLAMNVKQISICLCYVVIVFLAGLNAKLFGNNDSIPPNISSQIENKAYFVENKGQVTFCNGAVCNYTLYYVRSKGMTLYFTKRGIRYVFNTVKSVNAIQPFTLALQGQPNTDQNTGGSGEEAILRKPKPDTIEYHRGDMRFKNINTTFLTVSAYDTLDFQQSFQVGDQSVLGVRSFKKIVYHDLYPNIDWVISIDGKGGIKYDFIVKPGGNPSMIEYEYIGFDELSLTNDGQLKAVTPKGFIQDQAPFAYQTSGLGGQKKVSAAYELINNKVKFTLGAYDQTKTLVIDPYLTWSTYFGGVDEDVIVDIKVSDIGAINIGRGGNKFPSFGITGITKSMSIPEALGISLSTFQYENTFISYFKNDKLIATIIVGGEGYDIPVSVGLTISYDNNKNEIANVFVVGYTTSLNFANNFDEPEIFTKRYQPNKSGLACSTCTTSTPPPCGTGCNSCCECLELDIWDRNEDIFILSAMFVTASDNILVAKPTVTAMTYYGGHGDDRPFDMDYAVYQPYYREKQSHIKNDRTIIWVTGYTDSDNFPTTSEYKPELGSHVDDDNPSGVYNPYITPNENDETFSECAEENRYRLPTKAAWSDALNGSSDAFVLCFVFGQGFVDSEGHSTAERDKPICHVPFATYYGGSGADFGLQIGGFQRSTYSAPFPSEVNNLWVLGVTNSDDLYGMCNNPEKQRYPCLNMDHTSASPCSTLTAEPCTTNVYSCCSTATTNRDYFLLELDALDDSRFYSSEWDGFSVADASGSPTPNNYFLAAGDDMEPYYVTYIGGSNNEHLVPGDYPRYPLARLTPVFEQSNDLMRPLAQLIISGFTFSDNFPVTSGAYISTNTIGVSAVLYAINTNNYELTYSTYFGEAPGVISGIAPIPNTNSYLTIGYTETSTFHSLTNYLSNSSALQTRYQSALKGEIEIFWAIIDPSETNQLQFFTYFGGDQRDVPLNLDICPVNVNSGNNGHAIYAVGYSKSVCTPGELEIGYPTFKPQINGANTFYQDANAGDSDGILFRIMLEPIAGGLYGISNDCCTKCVDLPVTCNDCPDSEKILNDD